MSKTVVARLIELPDLRDRVRVFRDRDHAGRLLSGLLGEYRGSKALVMAVPAGGVPVAVTIGTGLRIAVDVAVPTGHIRALTGLAPSVRAVHCANVRTGQSFAVADAYEHWSDVSEEEATRVLRNHASTHR